MKWTRHLTAHTIRISEIGKITYLLLLICLSETVLNLGGIYIVKKKFKKKKPTAVKWLLHHFNDVTGYPL